ncbi:MAG: hypothetical protein PHV45_02395 [Desulfuromonas thiophila]|nr:hypothetical protein [Desulfuromonas thiophila]
MTSASVQAMLDQLLSEDLSGITFVRDYIQLQFNPPPTINVYSKCRLVAKEATSTFGEASFPNLVIEHIGQQVVSVTLADDQLLIGFENGSFLEIPFGSGTFVGPEAFEFWGRNDKWGVWP